MGLDISHIQLSLTPVDKKDYFYVKEWNLDCNVPLKEYSKYITTIDTLTYKKAIAVVKDEEQFEILKKDELFSASGFLNVFIGDINKAMIKRISQFITIHKLDKLEKFELGCEHDNIKYHTMYFGEPVKVQGVYYINDIGYQRDNMKRKFYEKFKKHMLFGEKKDFELAYTFVADKWHLEHLGEEAVFEMRRNFKENFVDKFEYGKSLLCVSF